MIKLKKILIEKKKVLQIFVWYCNNLIKTKLK
jgi:hypothetical protein